MCIVHLVHSACGYFSVVLYSLIFNLITEFEKSGVIHQMLYENLMK